MKAFLDTSVLIATFYAHHQFHQPSIALFLSARKSEACCGAHSPAETYASLTGRIGRDRVSGDQAMLFLGNVRARLSIISLTDREYFGALEASAMTGIAAGAICDAILGHCALKSKAETIYISGGYSMAHAVQLRHGKSRIVKNGYYGFSWTSFFFGGLAALFRGDIAYGLGVLVGGILAAAFSFGLLWFVVALGWAFIYNRNYTQRLLETGYEFSDRTEVVEKAKRALGID